MAAPSLDRNEHELEDDRETLRQLQTLARTPDFSAARANAKLESHEAICSERYAGLWNAIKELVKQVGELKDEIRARDTVQHDRFNTISNRMWMAVTAVCGASVLGLCVVVFHLLTKGAK